MRTWFGIKTLKNIFESQKFSWDLNALSSPFSLPAALRHSTVPGVSFLGLGTLLAHTGHLCPYRATGVDMNPKKEENTVTSGNVGYRGPREGKKTR